MTTSPSVNNENRSLIKQEYSEEVVLEPEQVLVEGGPSDLYYSDPASPFPGYDCKEYAEMDLVDPALHFQCNICGKKYKSQGSLQNHRSLYHRDLIGLKFKGPM